MGGRRSDCECSLISWGNDDAMFPLSSSSLPPFLPAHLLRDDSKATPERRQLQRSSGYAVDEDLAPCLRLHQAEEGEEEGALPAPGSSHHSDFGACGKEGGGGRKREGGRERWEGGRGGKRGGGREWREDTEEGRERGSRRRKVNNHFMAMK